MKCLYTAIGERGESVNDLRRCLAIRESNRVPDSVYYQYRNVTEFSLFHRYVIQDFKDFVTEGCGLYDLIAEGRWGINVLKQRTLEWITN